jgi:hypothetical protein
MNTPERNRPCDVTVVVACVEARRSIDRCLASIEAACRELRAEIVVVDASTDGTAEEVASRWPAIQLLRYPPGTLVPALWAAGLRGSSAPAVVFTIGQVIVPPEWTRALLGGLELADGAGGPMLLADAAGPVDWAVFYLRYSAFLPGQLPNGIVSGEIAGDNAAYRRAALDQHSESLAEGFWEVDFHQRLRRSGGRLTARRDAAVRFEHSAPLPAMLRHRFEHGRHFGAQRVEHGSSTARVALAAPVVPLVLALRAARRVVREPGYRLRFLAALPIFLVLAAAWSAGEAAGAVTGRS